MPNLKIFVSFEFDKDGDLKNSFFVQAKDNTSHRVLNFSLNEAYPNDEWKEKARSAIRECDLVIVLVGQDTHNSPGVQTEVNIAQRLKAGVSGNTSRAPLYRPVICKRPNSLEMAADQQEDRRSMDPETAQTRILKLMAALLPQKYEGIPGIR